MKSRFVLTTAALLAPIAVVTAQPPAPAPAPGMPDAAMMARHQQEHAQHRQEMAQDLAIVLRLTPAQQPALATWLQSMEPAHRDWHGDKDRDAAATTPDRLAAERQRLAAHQAEGEARIAATSRFYAQLDPQQRKVFDALDRLRGEHGMHGHGMHHHDRHGPGGPGRGGPGGQPGDMPGN